MWSVQPIHMPVGPQPHPEMRLPAASHPESRPIITGLPDPNTERDPRGHGVKLMRWDACGVGGMAVEPASCCSKLLS